MLDRVRDRIRVTHPIAFPEGDRWQRAEPAFYTDQGPESEVQGASGEVRRVPGRLSPPQTAQIMDVLASAVRDLRSRVRLADGRGESVAHWRDASSDRAPAGAV
jgi:hypothetical protein